MAASIPPHSSPAYAAAPRRSGLLYAVAGVVALAALAAMAIFLFGGRSAMPVGSPAETVATDSQKSLEAAKAALDQASRNVLNPPSSSSGQPAPEPAAAMPAASPGPPAEPTRAAATTEPPRPAQRPPAAAPAPKASSALAKSAAPDPAPAAAPAAAPPTQVASADRWAQMRSELAACPKSSLIPRCEQRIRERYCEGSWGAVPECPANSARK
jgi:hypothetical protein